MKSFIHIANVIFLVGLIVFGLFLYFGLKFVTQSDPYTGEYLFIATLFVIWGAFYYFQLRLGSIKGFSLLLCIEVCFLFLWIFVLDSVLFLEYIFE
ncbi:hypothetical protein [Halobacillus amylolyticus]|uniref:Uncharacterized protein n=1 Tax=Halobacillus amylolyticus TaxID=2932259 RepID=A0ABY4HG37_9BACI|nr:hypothetical protein [Halobacillus amylolyticus]UOR13709.1 hypothetical protein MUO15_09845 [Halobacillus amylolyticus]